MADRNDAELWPRWRGGFLFHVCPPWGRGALRARLLTCASHGLRGGVAGPLGSV